MSDRVRWEAEVRDRFEAARTLSELIRENRALRAENARLEAEVVRAKAALLDSRRAA